MTGQPLGVETDRFITIYRDSILPLKTRQVQLLGRKCTPRLLKTFLGYEVQLNRRRITCPDLTTARYLELFAQIGSKSIRIPYDPTKTAAVLPALTQALASLTAAIAALPLSDKNQPAFIRQVYRRIRTRLESAEREAGFEPSTQQAEVP